MLVMRLRSKFIFCCLSIILSTSVVAQDIPVPLNYTQIYDYLDELLTEGIILHQTAVRPYSRSQVATMLVEAQSRDSLMNKRQKEDLSFYLDVFALERDTIPGKHRYVQYTDHQTFDLSLANIQFSYLTKNKLFKLSLEPLLGMQVYGGKKGAIYKRWFGVDLKMDIAHHVSIWGSLRDQSYRGNWLSKKYFSSDQLLTQGAKLNMSANNTQALNLVPGTQYKEVNGKDHGGDFSDSKGGISLYAWFGSLSIKREEVRWGDAYHSSNIINNRAPAVPQVAIQLTPCKWFQFDYFHAWLVSNVLDSTRYYLENQTDGTQHKEYRPHNKFMAANMFTFIPIKYIQFSIGNSIVYAEDNVQAAYFIPIAFFKSLDHLLTKGTATQNQNSQVFGTITLRPVDHLKLYGSFYVDEFSAARLKKGNKERNPFSYVVGFDWAGWPIKGLSLKGEFSRTNIACYTHSIDVLDYTSNSYGLGHYMGDNAQSIFAELSYRPIRGMSIKLSYTNDTKYNSYPYLRVARDASGSKINPDAGIGKVLEQKPFDKAIYRNDLVALDFVYEVHPNMYLTANVSYNNARGYDNPTGTIPCEDTGDAQHYLDRFCPLFYQGKNVTAMVGFSFGF